MHLPELALLGRRFDGLGGETGAGMVMTPRAVSEYDA